ncbi:hypothetical protein HMPREF1337_00392 [Enterococcus faecalis ERV65]|uniref:Uncharacterized protein n=1 Tax=Enterococcus faecalis ERV63 TaxID=1134793 RepID=A0AAV3GI94_ENTFL|nr:hypothetical protein HMPREF1328_02669 [Enterococcus faecalis ERV103]EJU90186.1 hypothetical protein HMPREF1329_00752 [Enterococcus faecalis ERV116]EJU94091.1 hypothetical protein HMPREF1330_02744 [Enterococcus faecalis ERV129]EJV11286.1 hypothetical protein HMPREF1333_00488 [Enterococcus faecalis ERV37]EJV14037.1 hypothetical protein HMPREF1336_02773 [Enterococcus faecalis ERV63]EJV21733.1 hypothetical protein HMPREF1337_00392 [Enterococcus faecalis ERV65]EJV22381.1 hypothetical protein HM
MWINRDKKLFCGFQQSYAQSYPQGVFSNFSENIRFGEYSLFNLVI